MSTSEQTPAEKVLQECRLREALEKKVIDRSVRVHVDGPWPNTMPAEVLIEATRRLARDIGSSEVTPYAVDRMLEDVVIDGNWGSFYWDSSNKKRLKLNSPEWRDRSKQVSPAPSTGYTVGDVSGVYSR